MRTLVSPSFALILFGCAGDSPGGTTATEESTAADDDDDATTGAQTGSSTTSGSTSTGEESTSVASSGSTGPMLGCTPGDPCCNDAGEFEECWIDDASGLVWELVPAGGNPTAADALAYCDQLELLGSGGWRLPTIDELRTLLRGCSDVDACGLTNDCAEPKCLDAACEGCSGAVMEGPGMFGCYWDPNLLGTCDRYWSTTNTGTGLGWVVDFEDASVRQADAGAPAGLVRCVAN